MLYKASLASPNTVLWVLALHPFYRFEAEAKRYAVTVTELELEPKATRLPKL